MRLWLPLLAVLMLSACSRQGTRPDLPDHQVDRERPQSGELYAPHLKDGGPPVPPDISRLPEPVPVDEPRSRYGNRSPYTVLGRSYSVLPSARGYLKRGIASWYGNKFHGRPTSSFEPYDMYKFSAAHKTLPLPSYAQVTNLENGRSVVVRVNDRGPFHGDRLIDLSYAAAVKLGVHVRGTAQVEIRALVAEQTPTNPRHAFADAASSARTPRTDSATPRLYAHASPAAIRNAPFSVDSSSFLQVGSFAHQENAQRLQRRLSEAGFENVRIVTANVGVTQVWRVRVGPLSGSIATEQARRQLDRAGFDRPQLIRE